MSQNKHTSTTSSTSTGHDNDSPQLGGSLKDKKTIKFNDSQDSRGSRGSRDSHQNTLKKIMASTGIITAVVGGGICVFAALRYRVAKPSEYIVRTGIFIPKVAVDKKAFQLPFQTAKRISVQPTNYAFNLTAMSKEKMEFILPGVYTIGPKDENSALIRYSTLLSNTTDDELTHIIKGIIEGETRVLTASLSLEEIFSGRDKFREDVTTRINTELERLGLWIHNANIQEMSDHAGSEYFQFLRQRARASAENEARINIAEAKKHGDIAVKEREKETRIKTAEFESHAVTFENQRNIEIAESNALLKVQQANFDRQSEIARIESEKAAGEREAELQKNVETRRIEQLKEELRSRVLVKATVEAEAKERTADADLYAKKAEASGVLARFVAEADGLARLLISSSNNHDLVMQYLMVDRGLYPELAKSMGDAVRGMNPKINYWNTGSSVGNPMADLLKNIPASVDMLNSIGIKPPSWLMNTDNGNGSDGSASRKSSTANKTSSAVVQKQ